MLYSIGCMWFFTRTSIFDIRRGYPIVCGLLKDKQGQHVGRRDCPVSIVASAVSTSAVPGSPPVLPKEVRICTRILQIIICVPISVMNLQSMFSTLWDMRCFSCFELVIIVSGRRTTSRSKRSPMILVVCDVAA